jgi:hypothetical protein
VIGAVRSGVGIRLATPADSPALCELFSSITMKTDLELSIRRNPDFFALYRMQTDDFECWVGGEDGAIQGLGTIMARDGYLNGKAARIGYLGDLRVLPRLQGRRLIGRFYGPILQEFSKTRGCSVYLTTIIASNTPAVRALTGEGGRKLGVPPYRLLRAFDIRAVHLAFPRRRRRTGYQVRRATSSDIPTLAHFLDEDARRRPCGEVFSEAGLRRRLQAWPGLAIENFYLAFDHKGRLCGCCALWDAASVKRTLVMSYQGSMRWVKRGYNVAATLLDAPRLPSAGGMLHYAYLTHQAVPSEDPEVWRALLDAVCFDYRKSGYHFVSVCAFIDDPLEPAYRGFLTTNLRAHLYAVTPPGAELPVSALGGGRPGFEMALV